MQKATVSPGEWNFLNFVFWEEFITSECKGGKKHLSSIVSTNIKQTSPCNPVSFKGKFSYQRT